MRLPNLILKFRFIGETQLQVRTASRIQVGNGGLLFYNVQKCKTERLDLGQIQSFSLLPINPLGGPAFELATN